MITVREVARRLDLSTEGSLEEVADRIVDFAGDRDYYRAAARALKLHPRRVLRDRSARFLCARFGVWAALRDAGWSYPEIARNSTSERTWDHSTVRSGLLSLATFPLDSDRHRWAEKARATTEELLRRA